MSAKRYFAGLILIGATFSTTIALDYKIGTGSQVTANGSDNGLMINANIVSTFAGTTFSLNNGQSTQPINFFEIWTTETTIEADDWTPKHITAVVDFAIPDVEQTVHGVTVGGTYQGDSGGVLLWWDPVTVYAADREFTINLSSETFDLKKRNQAGQWVLDKEMVTATFTQKSSGGTTRVPEAGSTMVLLGIGLGAMSMVRRKTV